MDKVLVLNADYTPINVTSQKRGFKLVHKGKAEVVKESEDVLSSIYRTYIKPLIIRLLNYVSISKKHLKVSKTRIYRRDGFECVYCGSKKNLTIDHVVPKSKGGDNSWNNMVTCCNKCNFNKADRTPKEANMVMGKKPFEPSIFAEILTNSMEDVWIDYKKSFAY